MTHSQELRGVVKGKALTLEEKLRLLHHHAPGIGFRRDHGRTLVVLQEHFLSCIVPGPIVDRTFPALVWSSDEVTIDFDATEPEAGTIGLVALYDGYAYELRFVLFRQGEKGVEGYNYVQDKWLSLDRFAVLGLVVAHRIEDECGIGQTVESRVGKPLKAYADRTLFAEMRTYAWVRRILASDPGPVPLDLVLAGLGTLHLPEVGCRVGSFAVALSVANYAQAGPAERQFTRLFFEETSTIQPRHGLLSLIAHRSPYAGHEPMISAAYLVEEGGEMKADACYRAGLLGPSEYRFLRACVGGESPEGIRL